MPKIFPYTVGANPYSASVSGIASGVLAGSMLKRGYGDRVKLATKLPTYLVEERDDFERLLSEQLDKLETDHIDVYLLHALTADRWKKVSDLGVTDFLDQAAADGRIGCAGFSFHDQLPVFKNIVDSYDWTMCLIQLNFMDHEYQAGVDGLKYAAGRGLAVAIMEPLRGGKLARNVPEEAARIWARAGDERSPAEWALRWLWNFPEVSVVLSGMSTLEELRENMRVAASARPNSLSDEELAMIDEVREVYERRLKVGCTECGYCVPCPDGVAIPRIFSLYNAAAMYETWDESRRWYGKLLEDSKGTPACASCGACEDACPQGLPVSELLREAHDKLSPEGG